MRPILLTAAAALIFAVTAVSVAAKSRQSPSESQSPPVVSAAPATSAADRPKIAVYVFGADVPSINRSMATRLIAELANTGRYQTAENYREFFDRVAVEPKSAAGLISSNRMAALGKQFGLKYVCVAEIITVSGEKQVSAHILRVSDGEVAAMGGGGVTLNTFADLTVSAEQIVKAMFSGAQPAGSAPAGVPATEFTDPRDGKRYKTVNIGGAVWMARNLNYQAAVGSWCYGNDNMSCNAYGRLYEWNAAGAVCPPGWQLPSRQEWDNLVTAAGGSSSAGKKLKSITGWSISSSGFDEYGFSALPGGSRDSVGAFSGVGVGGYWWTGTPEANGSAYYRYISHEFDSMGEHSDAWSRGFSVRCVQK